MRIVSRMTVPKVYRTAMIVLLLLGGMGIALPFTLLEDSEAWLVILVMGMAGGGFFVAGCFSRRLMNAVFCPVVVLGSLLVAFTVYDEVYFDTEPALFAVILSVMYGGLASVIFAAGWLARWAVCQIRSRTIQCRDTPTGL